MKEILGFPVVEDRNHSMLRELLDVIRKGAREELNADQEPTAIYTVRFSAEFVQRLTEVVEGPRIEFGNFDSYIGKLPVLPEGAKVIRASGNVICEKCGKIYYNHKAFAYPTRMGTVMQSCEDPNLFYHL